MRDRATKVLLLLIFLALVLNAFVTLMGCTRADGGPDARYTIAVWAYGGIDQSGNARGHSGYYKMDTTTGEVQFGMR